MLLNNWEKGKDFISNISMEQELNKDVLINSFNLFCKYLKKVMSVIFSNYLKQTHLHKYTSLTWIWVTTEIQFNIKLFGDKHCCCKEGWLYIHLIYICTFVMDIIS